MAMPMSTTSRHCSMAGSFSVQERVGRTSSAFSTSLLATSQLLLFAFSLYSLIPSTSDVLVAALSSEELQNVACDLQSFIVEEPATKAHLLEVLSQWDAHAEMQVLVFNGHFATGKTYISNILAKALENIDVGGGNVDLETKFGAGGATLDSSSSGGAGGANDGADHLNGRGATSSGASSKTSSNGDHSGNKAAATPTNIMSTTAQTASTSSSHVAIFVTEDSFISSEQFYLKIDDILNTGAGDRMKIIVFDDLPCWRETERITRVLTRCMQFSNKCRGTLFVITSNDGWCADDYCNRNSDLDRQFDDLTETFTGNLKQLLTSSSSGGSARVDHGEATSTQHAASVATTRTQDLVRTRCRDVPQMPERLRKLFASAKRGTNSDKSSSTGDISEMQLFAATESLQSCALPGISLSREECEYRGCCCVNEELDQDHLHGAGSSGTDADSTGSASSVKNGKNNMKNNRHHSQQQIDANRCDFCGLEKSSEVTQAHLRTASAARSGRYIAKGLSEFPHFVVLGANGMIFQQEAWDHWGKLAERMLIQSFLEDDLPRLLSSQMDHAKRNYNLNLEILVNWDVDYPREFAKAGIEEVVAGEAPRNLRTSIKKLVRGDVKSQCLGGVCFLLKTKIQQLLMRQEQLYAAKKEKNGGSTVSAPRRAAKSAWNTLSGTPTGEKIALAVFLAPTETNPAQVAALSLRAEVKSDTMENKHVVDVQKFVGDGLGFHLRQLFHWGFADLITLLVRKRRPEVALNVLAGGGTTSDGSSSSSSSVVDPGTNGVVPPEQGTAANFRPTSLPQMLKHDGKLLREQIEEIEKSWTSDCPHLRLYDVKVMLPTSLPAECSADERTASGSRINSAMNEQYRILSPQCHFGNKDEHFCGQNHGTTIKRNPFYGSILVQFRGHPIWKVHKWLTRSERERDCDNYVADKWIYVKQVLVVPEWRHTMSAAVGDEVSAGASSQQHAVKAPEIASESKLGCLKERGPRGHDQGGMGGGSGAGGGSMHGTPASSESKSSSHTGGARTEL
ncbi:unnamed protein product [Amoebophrya sp. A120]|nr:unnamed protein product [Amoebophrya sp. A120]|eukprot:GSA120T00022557001.1